MLLQLLSSLQCLITINKYAPSLMAHTAIAPNDILEIFASIIHNFVVESAGLEPNALNALFFGVLENVESDLWWGDDGYSGARWLTKLGDGLDGWILLCCDFDGWCGRVDWSDWKVSLQVPSQNCILVSLLPFSYRSLSQFSRVQGGIHLKVFNRRSEYRKEVAIVAASGEVQTLVTELGGVGGSTDDGEFWGGHEGASGRFGGHFKKCVMRLLCWSGRVVSDSGEHWFECPYRPHAPVKRCHMRCSA